MIGIGAARRLVEGLLGDPNRRGRSYAVTVLAPISDGQTDALRAELRAFTSGDSPLGELAGVHFGRWVVVDELKSGWPGMPRPVPRVRAPYLLFTADVTAPRDRERELPASFYRQLAECERAARVWRYCRGYPAAGGQAAVAEYLAARQVDAALYFAAFPDLTVDEVRAALELHRRLVAFVGRNQGVAAAQLHKRYLAESRSWPSST